MAWEAHEAALGSARRKVGTQRLNPTGFDPDRSHFRKPSRQNMSSLREISAVIAMRQLPVGRVHDRGVMHLARVFAVEANSNHRLKHTAISSL
jgi:hypothetical protein